MRPAYLECYQFLCCPAGLGSVSLHFSLGSPVCGTPVQLKYDSLHERMTLLQSFSLKCCTVSWVGNIHSRFSLQRGIQNGHQVATRAVPRGGTAAHSPPPTAIEPNTCESWGAFLYCQNSCIPLCYKTLVIYLLHHLLGTRTASLSALQTEYAAVPSLLFV